MEFQETITNKHDEDSDEDEIRLPLDTQAILDEFLKNKTVQKSLELEQNDFEEDWQLSQFWYNESTKQILSRICLKLVHKHEQRTPMKPVKVALISCPSLYRQVVCVQNPNVIVRLFEFDTRFSSYGEDFVYYDYKDPPEKIPFDNYFDIILADPPFLSEECIEHVAAFINRLKKDTSDIIICSGQTAAFWIKETLNLHECEFRPEHERNLANEFRSYANFDLDSLI